MSKWECALSKEEIVLGVAVMLIGFGIGTVSGSLNERRIKQEAIEHGYAEYNAKTGVWQWKEKP